MSYSASHRATYCVARKRLRQGMLLAATPLLPRFFPLAGPLLKQRGKKRGRNGFAPSLPLGGGEPSGRLHQKIRGCGPARRWFGVWKNLSWATLLVRNGLRAVGSRPGAPEREKRNEKSTLQFKGNRSERATPCALSFLRKSGKSLSATRRKRGRDAIHRSPNSGSGANSRQT